MSIKFFIMHWNLITFGSKILHTIRIIYGFTIYFVQLEYKIIPLVF